MDRRILLHSVHEENRKIWVNVDEISFLIRDYPKTSDVIIQPNKPVEFTLVGVKAGSHWQVKETPEQILEAIDEVNNARVAQ